MAFDLASVQKGASHEPPRILIYGVQGIGKGTLAAMAPKPVFINIEDGLGGVLPNGIPLKDYVFDNGGAILPKVNSYNEIMDQLRALATQDHEYETLVIDSLDWMEPLTWTHVCEVNNWGSIEEPGFGRGWIEALTYWAEYVAAINYLCKSKKMTIIQTAHAIAKRFNDPTTEPYDRYQIKLQDKAAAKMLEHSDVVLFANYRVTTIKEGKAKDKVRAIGAGERIIYTEERPAFIAKNRYSLPAEIPLDWNELIKNIPYFNQKKEAVEKAA